MNRDSNSVPKLPRQRNARLANVESQMCTLDLLCFRGTDVVSRAVQLGQQVVVGRGEISHVGLVLRPEDMGKLGNHLELGSVYVMESTLLAKSSAPDAITKKQIFGVCIRRLADVIDTYEGEVSWAPLIRNPFNLASTSFMNWHIIDRRHALRKKMEKECLKYHRRAYDKSLWPLVAAALPCLRSTRNLAESLYPDLAQRVFCSELVARIYQRFRIIGTAFDPRDVLPMDLLGYDKDGLKCLVSELVKLTNG